MSWHRMTLWVSSETLISVERDIFRWVSWALRMKPTCLFLSLFQTKYIFNPEVFSLLFNNLHLYNSVSRGSQSLQQEFFCAFKMKRTMNREQTQTKSLHQLPSSVVSTLVREWELNHLIRQKTLKTSAAHPAEKTSLNQPKLVLAGLSWK